MMVMPLKHNNKVFHYYDANGYEKKKNLKDIRKKKMRSYETELDR